ncbi:rsph10b, partial [Symbiodinium sp. CCMP2592]
MLRITNLSGTHLANIPLVELSDVKALKQQLHKQHGLPPRFRQRILDEGKVLDDGIKLESPALLEVTSSSVMDLQVLILEFCEASEEQKDQLWDAADENFVAEA